LRRCDPSAHVDVWRPIAWSGRNLQPDRSVLKTAARLAPGATLAAAQTQLDAIAQRLALLYPRNMTDEKGVIERFTPVPLHEATVQRERAGLGLLLGGVALLLLVACLNVAHLVLARGIGRVREMSVRRPLGAGTSAHVRQLLLESLVLGGAGALLGLAFAWLGLRAFLVLRGSDLPVSTTIGLDPRIIAFACIVSSATAVVFGLFPAIRSIASDPADQLRGSSRSVTGGTRTALVQRAIVVAEVALSLMLVALTGVLLSSWQRVTAIRPGFEAEGLWTIPVTPTSSMSALSYSEAMDRIAASVAAVPGVESASYGLLMPFEMTGMGDCCWSNAGMVADGRVRDDVRVLMQPVHAEYFRTVGVRMVAGRTWSQAPANASPVPIVLSERLAIDFFGSTADALDETVRWPFGDMTMRVVGVAADTRHWGLDQPVPPFMYLPSWTVGYGFGRANLAVRTRGAASANLAHSLRGAIWRVTPTLPVPVVRSMDESIRMSSGGRQFNAIVFGAFGVVSLLLAAAGLYGTLLHHVRTRRRELGIRLALGAAPSRILRQTMASGLRMTLAGCLLGVPATWAAGRLFASRLEDVAPNDPLAIAGAAAVLLVTAAVASWLPGRNAGRTDPLTTLRSD
jgi:predicted permease